MAGILDSKTRFIDLIVTQEGRRQLASGKMRAEYASVSDINTLYDKILRKLNNNRYAIKIKYILGDFNQDLIKYDNHIDCQNFIDNAHNNGFVQLVSCPTRVTDHSATLIDLVFADKIKSTLSCNIITVDLCDHLATHTKLSLGSSNR